MGGQGSGRHGGFGRNTVESYRAIDINQLRRGGWLTAGRQSVYTWSRDGAEIAALKLSAARSHLRLSYRVSTPGGGWQDMDQIVDLEHVACHLGGSRPFFICPGNVNQCPCRRRVAKLYTVGQHYLCRHCHQLTYSCQQEQFWDRKVRRADKIRMRLGGSPGIYTPFPSKPRGIWWRTYERLYSQAMEASAAAECAILDR